MISNRLQPHDVFWHSLHNLQSEMNRLIDRWSNDRTATGTVHTFPLFNMWEDGDTVWLTAELPGVEINDIEVFFTGDRQITIRGERKPRVQEKVIIHRQEIGVGKFSRTRTLPFPVDSENADVRLKHGILQIKMPKHESAKPRKIPIKAEL